MNFDIDKGSGVFVTGGAIQDQEFMNALMANATADNPFFIANHSAGGARQYVNLLNANPNQFVDKDGNAIAYIQLNGAPVYNPYAQNAADYAGVNYLGNKVNDWDFVGNGLGANNGWGQFLGSGLLSYKLFTNSSPHSSYYCQGAMCSYNQIKQSGNK